MKIDLTQNTKYGQKKIYDQKVNRLRRQVNLDLERLMCQAEGPEELKRTGLELPKQQDYDKAMKYQMKSDKQMTFPCP